MQTTTLPVFVYGTLRNGEGNYQGILAGNTISEIPARLPHATMYDGGCPFVVAEGTGTVTGEVMALNPDTLDETMARLDRLEGYRGPGMSNMYDRVRTTVETTDGPVEAWVYLCGAGSEDWLDDMPVIESGDWLAHIQSRRSDIYA